MHRGCFLIRMRTLKTLFSPLVNIKQLVYTRVSILFVPWPHKLLNHSSRAGDLETLLEKNLLRKESQLPTSLEQVISFVAPFKAAFDCLYKLLLIAESRGGSS